jgi:Flp pilus assembly protein TadG
MKVNFQRASQRSRGRRGVAAVELALVLPLLFFFLLGAWEVGRLVQINQIVSNAAREGARQASTGTITYDQVNTVVINYLTSAGITNQNNLQVNIINVTQNNSGAHTHGGGVNDYSPNLANELDQLQVTVSLPFDNVGWTVLDFTTNSSTQVTATATWFSMQDQSYPSVVVPPPGW